MTTKFYENLPVFTNFTGFTDFSSYTDIPDDWIVLISDVVGSTRAIKDGRYKDVNMVGAASITSILNACGSTQVPFVFGGDGGTVVVPAELKQATSQALRALKAHSQEIFGLELRIGAIPVADLVKQQTSVKVRKFELSEGNFLAMFAGGGMELADQLLKDPSPDNPYLLEVTPQTGAPDLEGLSCRWQPLTASKGKMLTMMIKASAEDPEKERDRLATIIKSIEQVLGTTSAASAPANEKSMHFGWPPAGLAMEARATAGTKGYWRTYIRALFTSLVQWFCEKLDKKAGDYDGAKYRNELRSNTDFRKFDGILRMVLDVTDKQVQELENWLAQEHRAGNLVYGTHVADTALMTCLVFSLEQSEHVHFIDGSDGGFAMAAIDFKSRLSEVS
jgi:hypothetical protein